MKKDYGAMDHEALAAELARLRENLRDLEETFTFNLTHTTAHLRSGLVAEHEQDIQDYRDTIATVEALLGRARQ